MVVPAEFPYYRLDSLGVRTFRGQPSGSNRNSVSLLRSRHAHASKAVSQHLALAHGVCAHVLASLLNTLARRPPPPHRLRYSSLAAAHSRRCSCLPSHFQRNLSGLSPLAWPSLHSWDRDTHKSHGQKSSASASDACPQTLHPSHEGTGAL